MNKGETPLKERVPVKKTLTGIGVNLRRFWRTETFIRELFLSLWCYHADHILTKETGAFLWEFSESKLPNTMSGDKVNV